MKVLVGAFNQEKALVVAFSVITNIRMELFEALVSNECVIQHNTSLIYWSHFPFFEWAMSNRRGYEVTLYPVHYLLEYVMDSR